MIRPATRDDADAIWDIFQRVVAGRDSYVFLPDTPRDEAVGYWLGRDAITRVAEIDGDVEPAQHRRKSFVHVTGNMIDQKSRRAQHARAALTDAQRRTIKNTGS